MVILKEYIRNWGKEKFFLFLWVEILEFPTPPSYRYFTKDKLRNLRFKKKTNISIKPSKGFNFFSCDKVSDIFFRKYNIRKT